AASHGLYLAILPFWLKGSANNIPDLLDPATAEWFCHYLAWRYRDKPVIWILGGDTAGHTPDGPDYTPLVRAMAAGLRAGDGGAHLITYHPTGKQSSSFWFQDEPWLSFDLIQSGHFIQNTNYEIIAADYLKTPTKPVVDGEPGYENITDRLIRGNPNAVRIGAADVRRYGYLGVFAGAAGHTYGNGEVYEFWEPGGAPMPGWGANLPWRQSLQLPGSSQMQYLRWLIQSRPMLTRIPDQNLITTETYRTTERIEGTRATDGSYALIYSAAGKPFTVRTSLLSGSTLRATWYSPRDGTTTLIGEMPKTDTHDFTPPTSGPGNDWVLVLDDTAANYPPPGTHTTPAPAPSPAKN
ncbi:MAG: glycoside hydrolase family 140 protein, partial [Opitutales bacterium]